MIVRAALLALVGVVVAPRETAIEPGPVSPSGQTSKKKGADRDEGDDAIGGLGTQRPLATLVNVHTHEAMVLDEREPSSAEFSMMLADRVTGASKPIDARLLGLLRALAARQGGERLELVSGYRSPKLNEMLRKKGHRVASHSQHSLGHAVDFRLGSSSPAELRRAVEATGWVGGIGQYDGATDRFIHVDVGRARRWHER